MATIALTKGMSAEVDDDLLDLLKDKNWYFDGGYARAVYCGKRIHMHRVVLELRNINIPEGMCVDHININKLDNRSSNLRIVTHAENMRNQSEQSRTKWRVAAAKATAVAASLPRTKRQLLVSSAMAKKMNESGLNRHCGSNNYMSKRVFCSKTNRIFNSVREASNVSGINYSTLRSMLQGKHNNWSTLEFC